MIPRPPCLAALVAVGFFAWSSLCVAASDPPSAGGGDEAGLVLRLGDAADLALRGPDRTPPEIARWRVREEKGRLWPSLNLEGRYSYESSQIATRNDTTLIGPGLNAQRTFAGLGLSYNLLQFLESEPRIKSALAEERASVLRLSEAQRERIVRATDAYLTLLAEQETLAAFERLRREHVAFLRRQETRFAEDAIPMIEVIRARTQIVAVDRESLAARRRAASAELELRRLTGLKPDDRITLAFDRREVDLSLITSRGLPGLLELARTNNPRILAADASAESAKWAAAATRTVNYPKLSVTSNAGYGADELSDGTNIRSSDFRYSVFLILNIPLFDGGVRRAQIAQSELTAQSRRTEARQIAEEVKAQVEDLYWTHAEREQARDLLEQEIKLVDDELRQATARADAGIGSTTELLTALSRLVRLRQDLARVSADLTSKGVALLLAAGRNPFVPASAQQEPLGPSSPHPDRPVVPDAAPAPSPAPPLVSPPPLRVENPDIRRMEFVIESPRARVATELQPLAASDESAGGATAVADAGSAVGEAATSSSAPTVAAPPAESSAPTAPAPAAAVVVAPPAAASAPPAPAAESSVVVAMAPPTEDSTPPADASTDIRRATTLRAVDVTRQDGTTTVTIHTDGRLANYTTFWLGRPSRFVIDLPVLAEGQPTAPHEIEGDTQQVRRVRLGRYQDHLRVVLDLVDDRARNPLVVAQDDGLRIILGRGR